MNPTRANPARTSRAMRANIAHLG